MDMAAQDAEEHVEDYFTKVYDAFVDSWPNQQYVKHERSLVPKTRPRDLVQLKDGPPLHKSINLVTSRES